MFIPSFLWAVSALSRQLFFNSKRSRNLLSSLTCFLYQKDVYLWQLIRMSFKPSIDHSTPTLNANHYFYWLYNKIKICSEILIFTLKDCSFYIDCLLFTLHCSSNQNKLVTIACYNIFKFELLTGFLIRFAFFLFRINI